MQPYYTSSVVSVMGSGFLGGDSSCPYNVGMLLSLVVVYGCCC